MTNYYEKVKSMLPHSEVIGMVKKFLKYPSESLAQRLESGYNLEYPDYQSSDAGNEPKVLQDN